MSAPKVDVSGTKPPPEKSKFAQTCNRLSLFLKEKGNNIQDKLINPRIFDATTKGTTADLLSNMAKTVPEYVILDSSCDCEIEDPTTNYKAASIDDQKPKTAQMTIFYQGQVVVLDDVPADRARDLMLQVATPKQAKDSDLPIARRASLHKFLAKRKDRATIRSAPYQYQYQLGSSSSGNQHTFDLNM